MAEYSKLARGSFITAASPVAQVIVLPFQPTSIVLTNQTAYSSPAQYAVTRAYWDTAMGQGVSAIEYIESGSAPWILAADYVSTAGISTFAGGQLLQFGAQLQIASISKAASAVVTTASAHGLSSGQVVILEGLYQSSITGMPQISNIPFVITVTGTTTFTIPFNTNQSNYTALSGSPTGAYVRQVLYPFLYEPGVNFISSLTLSGTNVVVNTANNHNFVVGQQIAFRIPSAFGSTQLNSLPNTSIPGSPVYYYVTSLGSNTQFTCSALSSGVTAFNSNQTVASVPGLTWAQVVAVGDVNSGGVQYSGGVLYPSAVLPTYTGGVPTYNGPSIQGSFVNNTQQGFVIGTGTGTAQTSALLLTASSTYIWEAKFSDIG
jgi:hypothetical protein